MEVKDVVDRPLSESKLDFYCSSTAALSGISTKKTNQSVPEKIKMSTENIYLLPISWIPQKL